MRPTSATTADDRAAFLAAHAFERRLRTRACQQVVEHPLGLAFYDSRVPEYFAFNFLEIPGPVDPGLDADGLVAVLDEQFDDFRHRRAFIQDAAAGERLARDFRERGWRVDREIVMALRGERDREPSAGLARETDVATLRAVETQTLAEDPFVGTDPHVIPQLLLGRDLFCAAAQRTRFFVGADRGVDASTATLYADGDVVQIEDVATLTAHRNRGLARATVTAAVDAAVAMTPDLVFLFADDEDWPKQLYAKLGFRAVGTAWAFTLPNAA